MKEEVAPNKKIYQVRIAKLFRAVRKQFGLSQKKLSEKLNISQGFLSKIEAGVSIPDIVVWLSFCRDFHLSPSLILSDDEFFQHLNKIDPGGSFSDRADTESISSQESVSEEQHSMATS